MLLATSPCSWGVDFADNPTNPPWTDVLDGIAASGCHWTELGPLGFLPEDHTVTGEALRSRGLNVAGSFVFEPLHDPTAAARILDVTNRTCDLIRSLGGQFLVVIDLVTDDRAATAGRSAEARRLSTAERKVLFDNVARVIEVARDRHGLRPLLHPHVGSYVEFEDEVESMLAAFPPDALELCFDTGHAAYAGIDPVAFYANHHTRIPYLHLKDVDADVHRGVLRDKLGFWDAIEAGIFCPVGQGLVDFEGLVAELRARGFDGPVTLEQDRDASAPGDPLADVLTSVAYLERLGFRRN